MRIEEVEKIFSNGAMPRSSILLVNFSNLVSHADLTYDKPVSRSEEGLPVGNGRMGSLVWTSPSALKFQINRVDVYANNSYTNSFNKRNSDYGYGCGFVDIDFVDFGEDVFPNERTLQHLSAYDGLVTVKGKGITARILAWHKRDVMVIDINDQREQAVTINTNLRMLRSAAVKTKNHTATSKLGIRDGRIILTQEFTEGEYYCSSAVVIGILGREVKAKLANETEVRLAAEPGKGSFTILIASAASFDRKEDVIASALDQLDAAAAKGYDGLFEENKKWWHDFWSKSFIHLHSDDGVADYIEENYTYYLYVMALSSRGKFPPNYGGMIWSTGGDYRAWGVQQWWHNVSCYYRALLPANRLELMDPMFDMYTGMYDACALAACQQWGSKGIFIPETVWFDGLAELPDDIAEEMRDLYLLNKPWEQRSIKFREYAETKHPHSSRWNWKGRGSWVEGHWNYTQGSDPYSCVVHIFSSGAKIAYQYWLRYQYTQDMDWLRNRAYPMLKGIAEFYRNYPNVKKGEDGKYHIHNVNNHEPLQGAQDTMEEVAAMRGILPTVIKASEILNVDTEMQPIWREFLDNLAPLPTNDQPNALNPKDINTPRLWSNGLKPIVHGKSVLRQETIVPCIHYDLCTLETDEKEMIKIANATFENIFPNGIGPGTSISAIDRKLIAAPMLGRADVVKIMLPNQIRCLSPEKIFENFVGTGRTGVLANRMSLSEGIQAIGVERLGRASEVLQLALCQSVPAGPGKEPITRVFPAWPRDWDAEYTLLCRGGFLVTSSMQKGQIEFVEVKSQLGGEYRLRNPWGEVEVTLYRGGKKWKNMDGSLLKFKTCKGENIVVVKRGSSPDQFKRVILGNVKWH